MPNHLLPAFLPIIRTLKNSMPLTKEDLLKEKFLIKKDGELEMYYAPHNEYINKTARIIIVGITPGWSQMKIAYEHFVKGLAAEKELEGILKETKMAAGFAGSMRANLISMLNQCGIPKALHINSSNALFHEKGSLLHTTSIIKYPVFYRGQNYTGHQPGIFQSNLLAEYATKIFADEIGELNENALIIPLGKTVESIIRHLLGDSRLTGHTFLFGFPHPSGANGHRIRQFEEQKYSLAETVRKWSEQKKNLQI
ncbi:hypothetical protein J7I93_23945 [Bacillus sp. ISL-47]|uniref:hypothetical protein n=1 Tax=Bacillus sp. ISL-47 TaxID=2819130 RepID=UPI001BE66F4A|nr:hypothetical protein [Bacillus sp. ISL-47]MBT2691191.1 hypothetical protein [Bacillus sp. ISL-47]